MSQGQGLLRESGWAVHFNGVTSTDKEVHPMSHAVVRHGGSLKLSRLSSLTTVLREQPCLCAEGPCVQGILPSGTAWSSSKNLTSRRTNRDIHKRGAHRSLSERTPGRGCSHRCCGLCMQAWRTLVESKRGNSATCNPRSSGYWENTHHRVVGPGSAPWESGCLERQERVPNA